MGMSLRENNRHAETAMSERWRRQADALSCGCIPGDSYNLSGWKRFTNLLSEWGVLTDEFTGYNDGKPISDATCKRVADALDEHIRDLPFEDQMWLAGHSTWWRNCGGCEQF